LIFLTSFKKSFFIRIPNKPAQSLPALRVVHCSTSGFFSLRSKDPSLSEFRTNQRKACQRFAWFTARLQDFSHFVQKILLYPNSEQTSAKPARASRCSLFLCPPHFDASIAWFWA
jgi:hypothetical protein